MLIFRAKYFDCHNDLEDGYYEFRTLTWQDAVKMAQGRCYKNAHDGLKSLELVGKIVEKPEYF